MQDDELIIHSTKYLLMPKQKQTQSSVKDKSEFFVLDKLNHSQTSTFAKFSNRIYMNKGILCLPSTAFHKSNHYHINIILAPVHQTRKAWFGQEVLQHPSWRSIISDKL